MDKETKIIEAEYEGVEDGSMVSIENNVHYVTIKKYDLIGPAEEKSDKIKNIELKEEFIFRKGKEPGGSFRKDLIKR